MFLSLTFCKESIPLISKAWKSICYLHYIHSNVHFVVFKQILNIYFIRVRKKNTNNICLLKFKYKKITVPGLDGGPYWISRKKKNHMAKFSFMKVHIPIRNGPVRIKIRRCKDGFEVQRDNIEDSNGKVRLRFNLV